MLNYKSILAIVFASFASFSHAASCPADAPEGYKWLSGYVDEFREKGTVSDWFSDSLKKNPDDVALLGLKAFFDAGGDISAARELFKTRGGSEAAFEIAMACAKVE